MLRGSRNYRRIVATLDSDIETQMLNALELLHYGNRFRGQLFALFLDDEIELSDIITDLRVIHAAQIRVILFCENYPELADEVEGWNRRGTRMRYFLHSGEGELAGARSGLLKESLRTDIIPVVALERSSTVDPKSETAEQRRRVFTEQALDAAVRLQAVKLFFVSTVRGLEVDGKLQSHPSPEELGSMLGGSPSLNIPQEELAFMVEQRERRGIDLVLLQGSSGSLFQEIFTHRGKGTLFTKDYANIVRRGRLSDVTEIALLMRPYIASGSILPVGEEDLAREIESYFVYTVNGAIVATAKLADYGDAAELAKMCTLPRFQGRGRARRLAETMIEEAKAKGLAYVFSLSIEPKMWQFFLGLGFEEVSRESLPPKWVESYDFSRPSKAFRLNIG